MTTERELRDEVLVTDVGRDELSTTVSAILERTGEVLSVTLNSATQQYVVARLPQKTPRKLMMNIYDLVREIKEVPKTLTPMQERVAQFTQRQYLREETIASKERLAHVLSPRLPAHHLIPGDEMALILLRAFQAGVDACPKYHVRTDTQNNMIVDIIDAISLHLLARAEADVEASREGGHTEQEQEDRRRVLNIKKARDLLAIAQK